jgi:hypothetical protein
MRRISWLVLPLAVAALVLLGVAISEAQRTPEWQQALNQYLRSSGGSPQQVIRAAAPEQLDPSLLEQLGEAGQFEGLALPMPPRTVYCVLVTKGQRHSVLFVSYFSDNLWRDDWVVHQGPAQPFSTDTVAALSVLGCDFS